MQYNITSNLFNFFTFSLRSKNQLLQILLFNLKLKNPSLPIRPSNFWVTEEEDGELPHELDFDDIIEQAIYDEDDATPITIGGST